MHRWLCVVGLENEVLHNQSFGFAYGENPGSGSLFYTEAITLYGWARSHFLPYDGIDITYIVDIVDNDQSKDSW